MTMKTLTEKDKQTMQLKYGIAPEDILDIKCYICQNFPKIPDCSTECVENNLVNYRPVLKYCSTTGLPCSGCNCE